jgi:hypothetical protein
MMTIRIIFYLQFVAAFSYGWTDEETFYPYQSWQSVAFSNGPLLSWNSREGQARLKNSEHSNSFSALALHFHREIKPGYSGIASAVIVLNALPTKKIPFQKRVAPLLFTQDAFLNERTERVKSRSSFELPPQKTESPSNGLSLIEFQGLVLSHGTRIEVIHVSELKNDTGLEHFRNTLKKNLLSENKFIVVCFQPKLLGIRNRIPQHHFSPVGAYHKGTDSILIMDVSNDLSPWYWVPAQELFRAMKTGDTQNRGGGYAIIGY